MKKTFYLMGDDDMCTYFFEVSNWDELDNEDNLNMSGELFFVDTWGNSGDDGIEYIEAIPLAKVNFEYYGVSSWDWVNTMELYSLRQAIGLARATSFCYMLAERYLDGFDIKKQGRDEVEMLLKDYYVTDEHVPEIRYL